MATWAALVPFAKERLGIGRLDFAAVMAVTFAIAIGTVAVVKLSDQLKEIAATASLVGDGLGRLAGGVAIGIFAGVNENVLPGNAVLDFEFLGVIQQIVFDGANRQMP